MRALLSVYDKTGLIDLARRLADQGCEILSSGGTSKALNEAGIAHKEVQEVTGAPEMLDGRVKTLHPAIHGGILADRSKPSHMDDIAAQQIQPIDLVVCNLYPFTANPSIEMIDVGGPTMVRAAAKNHAHVGIVVDPSDYDAVATELESAGRLGDETRLRLARKAFAHTASYDAAITEWLAPADGELPSEMSIRLEKAEDLRYGENPHQIGARYREAGKQGWWDSAKQHSGMALSYLNIFDGDAAWRLVHEISDGPAAVIVKHANPCGVAIRDDIVSAYQAAFECDEMSAFGGIVALNRPVDMELANAIVANPKADLLIATGYAPEALELFATKRKNMRVIEAPGPVGRSLELRRIDGGFLVQQPDVVEVDRAEWKVATEAQPNDTQWGDIELAWRVCAATGSNAIVFAKDGRAVGVGAGQQNRKDSTEIAARKAGEFAKGAVVASDAFFPFRDGLDAAAGSGAAVIVQPGGSMRDQEVIDAANEHGVVMILTGTRHFKH